MKVIVTGAGGFIGNSILKHFKETGNDVTGWDISASPEDGIISVDMRDQAGIEKALEGERPEVIVHCAGSANVSDSVANPDRDLMLSVGITHNLLFAMLHHDLGSARMIYLSSAGVYGNPVRLPIREEDDRSPVSPYALHKTMCEDICSYFVKNHGFDIRMARIFSAYGAGLKKQIFWDMHQKYLRTGRLDMFGTGKESRDFINIEDLRSAIRLLAEKDYPERIVNVANGREVFINEVVSIFAEKMGIPDSAVCFTGTERVGDPINWRADISVLKSLGYEQQISIEAGIEAYCDWIRKL